MTLSPENRPHSPVGPSSFQRAETCTASAIDADDLEPVPPSVYAAEGNLHHAVMAQCLQSGDLPFEYIGEVWTEGEHELVFDEDMADRVGWAIEEIRTFDDPKNGYRMQVEETLRLGETMLFGTADVLLIPGNDDCPIRVFDLKAGWLNVEPQTPQLGLYGLMAADVRFPDWRKMDPRRALVDAHVLQPQQGGHKRHYWTVADLIELEERAYAVIDRVERRVWQYQAGEHCRFCGRIQTCPELARVAQDSAMAQVVHDRAVSFDADELDRRLEMLPAIDLYVKKLNELAFAYLQAGGVLTAVKLVNKRAIRQWKDEAEAQTWMHKHGIPPWQPRKLKSPNMAEKSLPKKLVETMNTELVEKKSSGLTLAPASDPREEVIPVSRRLDAKTKSRMADQIKNTKPKKEKT